jgi:hypothetical protein
MHTRTHENCLIANITEPAGDAIMLYNRSSSEHGICLRIAELPKGIVSLRIGSLVVVTNERRKSLNAINLAKSKSVLP